MALRSGVMRHHGRWGLDVLEELGAKVGSQEREREGLEGFCFGKNKRGKLKGMMYVYVFFFLGQSRSVAVMQS